MPVQHSLLFAGAAVVLSALVTTALLHLSARAEPFHGQDAVALMAGTFLAILTELKPTRFLFGRAGSEVTLTIVVVLPILMLYGWPTALLAAVLAVATADLQAGKAWYKIVFNCANYALSTWAAGLLYDFALQSASLFSNPARAILAGTAAGLLSSFVNTTLVGLAIAIVGGLPPLHVLRTNTRLVAPVSSARIGLGVIAALLWATHPVSLLLLIPPMIATKLSYDHYVRLRVETDHFIEALADTVDLRDPSTANHSRRVAQLVRALAVRLCLSTDDVHNLEIIARVHDVGKVAVPDTLLMKTEPLTPAEYEEMKRHVEAGVRILEHLSLYRGALEILAQHHERLDGSGYPRGLRGDEIIFPARVLAVADAYDAMTTDRPYRPAKTPEEAVRELYRVAGKEYDLNVVRALEDELIARGVLKGPVVPAALEAARQEAEAEEHAAARTPRVVPLPRVGSGRNPP